MTNDKLQEGNKDPEKSVQKPVSVQHRQIPVLHNRPLTHPIEGQIYRSYPVGKQNFSRACEGEVLDLKITTENPLPNTIKANLITTINVKDRDSWVEVPFMHVDENTLICHIKLKYPGLHIFKTEVSQDKGANWYRDSVPDSWVLIDPPQIDGLRLYTMIPTVSGTLADWKKDLKRIKDMGFNAIHLLPITTMDTSQSPYSAKDLFDIDQSYLQEGSKQDSLAQLEEYVMEAKLLNIRLCFDLVLNHIGVNSNMVRDAPDWIVADQNQPDGFKRARYWSDKGWRNWEDLVLINFEHPSAVIRSEIWAYMTEYALFWAKYANDTGGFVRSDNLHSSDPDFIQSFTTRLHSEYPEVGLLAEYFTDEQTLLSTVPNWGINLVLAMPWNYKFVPELREYLKYLHSVSEQIRYFMPITSHDSCAPAQEFGTADSTVPRYVAAALLGTGATGIVQGVEFGENERINFIGRKQKMAYPAEARFARFIGLVNSILAEYSAFRSGKNYQFVDNNHNAIIAVYRQDTTMQAFGFLVVCNFDTHSSQHISIDLAPILGKDIPVLFHDLISGETKNLHNPLLDLLLQPCTAQVLKFPRSVDTVHSN